MPKVLVDNPNHGKIVQRLLNMVKISDNKLQERVRGWELAEQMNQSYLPAADAERMLKQDKGKWTSSFTELTIPYCYAVQMAMHTYLATVFLSRSPIFQVLGRNGQGQDQVFIAEALMDYQVTAGRMLTPQYLFLNDVLQYGVGITGFYWDKEQTAITAYEQQPVLIDGMPVLDEFNLPKTEEVEHVQIYEGYSGHKQFNVRPKEFIMDTRVGLSVFQEGEFCGRRLRMHTNTIRANGRKGVYFNTEGAISGAGAKSGDLAGDNNALLETSDELVYGTKRQSGMVNLIELYVKIVPSEWGLGKNNQDEIWLFTIANNDLLIGAQPSGWIHGEFPYAVQPMEYDAYGLSSRGVPVIGQSLNNTLDWLINSHMYNVKKSVNNEYLYDPSMIDTRDFLDPRPGKRIRLKPSAYGKDVRTMVHQFSQVDYTRNNLSDVAFIEGLFQRIFGTSPQTMGAMNAGGRKSATEIRTATAGGMSRLKVMAEYFSANSYSMISRQLLAGSRQMYDQEMTLRIAGNMGASGMQSIAVNPQDITGEFDFVPVDGTLPLDRFAMASVYKELLMGITQMPQVAGRYDIAGIFAWTAKMSGIKNLDTFEIRPEDEGKILQEAQRGNLVTTGEVLGGQRGAAGGTGEGSQGIAGVPIVPGLGAMG